MSNAEENRSYFRQRAQQSRESAMRAADPAVRRIHLDMAETYDSRSRDAKSVTPLIIPAINDR